MIGAAGYPGAVFAWASYVTLTGRQPFTREEVDPKTRVAAFIIAENSALFLSRQMGGIAVKRPSTAIVSWAGRALLSTPLVKGGKVTLGSVAARGAMAVGAVGLGVAGGYVMGLPLVIGLGFIGAFPTLGEGLEGSREATRLYHEGLLAYAADIERWSSTAVDIIMEL